MEEVIEGDIEMMIEYFKIKKPEDYLVLKRLRGNSLRSAKMSIVKSGKEIVLGISTRLVDKIVSLSAELDSDKLSNEIEFPKAIIDIVLESRERLKNEKNLINNG